MPVDLPQNAEDQRIERQLPYQVPEVPEVPDVFVVEDELLVALDLSGMIEEAGFEVLGPAPTVEKALALLAAATPAAAFLDESLDGRSIAPVAQELTQRGVPFVIISGHVRSLSDDPVLSEARRIQKPAAPHQIRAMLAEFRATGR